MVFTDMQSFVRHLEKEGQLQRVRVEVDPELEITEIATRAVREGRPALLFENVKGSKYPLVINMLGSKKRIEMGLGRDPEEIGEELVRFAQDVNPPSLGALWRNRKTGFRLLKMRPKTRGNGPAQEIIEEPDLTTLPALKCWPGDGGRFITLPLVFSRDPDTGDNNVGMYRMQIFNATTTGMHMQIQKGGGFHYFNAENDPAAGDGGRARRRPCPHTCLRNGAPRRYGRGRVRRYRPGCTNTNDARQERQPERPCKRRVHF